MTDKQTTGQQLVEEYERNIILHPGDLANSIDSALRKERHRCADISTAVFLNRGTCKQATDHGKGWNAACADINHRITTEGICRTQSPIPAMVQALQDVKGDGEAYRTFHSVTITENTLTAVCEALEQVQNPKEL